MPAPSSAHPLAHFAGHLRDVGRRGYLLATGSRGIEALLLSTSANSGLIADSMAAAKAMAPTVISWDSAVRTRSCPAQSLAAVAFWYAAKTSSGVA